MAKNNERVLQESSPADNIEIIVGKCKLPIRQRHILKIRDHIPENPTAEHSERPTERSAHHPRPHHSQVVDRALLGTQLAQFALCRSGQALQ